MSDKAEGRALTLPANIRADLLKAQMQSISDTLELPRVKIMAAGVGRYEFTDTNETTEAFEGVILGSHPRNVLWQKKYGAPSKDESDQFPACSSRDGITATPQEGFRHIMLGGDAATGTERIQCGTCTYNKLGTGTMLIADRNPRGKACSNQKSVYIMLANRQLPVELMLPAMSIIPFDKYLAQLLDRSTPVQAVLTQFTQKIVGGGAKPKYGNPVFTVARHLTQDEFDVVLEQMNRFRGAIDPGARPERPDAPIVVEPTPENDSDDLPF